MENQNDNNINARSTENFEPGSEGRHPCPPLLTALPPAIGTRRPTGKVARLPRAIREQVNLMLDEGHTYRRITQRLAELGYPGFSHHNILRWKKGGHCTWLVEQDRRDLQKVRSDAYVGLLKNLPNSSELADASEGLLGLHVFRALQELQDCPDADLLSQRSARVLRFVRTAAKQQAERTNRDRLALRKEIHQTDIVNYLLAHPDKLTAILEHVREKMVCAAKRA